MTHIDADLAGSENIYAVSNVPLFLLRRLQADAAPRAISSSFQSNEIVNELSNSLRVKPQTLRDAVKPYVLLVALEQKRDLTVLKTAAALNAPYHDWFAYLSAVLVQTFNPSVIRSLDIPGQIHGAMPSSNSTAATTTSKLILTP
jgi:hypothetical protein